MFPDEDDFDEIEDEDYEEEEEVAPPVRRKPVATAPTPVPSATLADAEDDVTDEDFDTAAKKRRDEQVVTGYLKRKKDDEAVSVEEITDLILSGDQDKIVHALYPYCDSNTGIKRAKHLLREGLDHAKARVQRIARVAAVELDELKQESSES